jgi:hypothetical protein
MRAACPLSGAPAAAAALAGCVGSANASCPKDWANPPSDHPRNALSNFFEDAAVGMNPAAYEQRKREEAARATYRALLQAGAPEETACAAGLNPDFFRIVAPQYLRPQR